MVLKTPNQLWSPPKTRVETDQWRDHFSAKLICFVCWSKLACAHFVLSFCTQVILDHFVVLHVWQWSIYHFWLFRHACIYFYLGMLDPLWNVQDAFTFFTCFRARFLPVCLLCFVVCACSLHKTNCASWVILIIIMIKSEDLKTVLSLF